MFLCCCPPIGDPGDPTDSVEARYHGGSGTDKFFRLEFGEHINAIEGAYGAEHIHRLRFFTTRGRASEQFGAASGTDFRCEAPEGYVLHKIAGHSDGYLNGIRFYFAHPIVEPEPVPGLVSDMQGPLKGNPFNDKQMVGNRVIRRLHLRANTAVDGIQAIYSEPNVAQQSMECPYHGGSGTDRYWDLKVGEFIVKMTGMYGSDHIERLQFTTNTGRVSELYGTNRGTEFTVRAPAGTALHFFSGRSDGYLNSIRAHFKAFTEVKDYVPDGGTEEKKAVVEEAKEEPMWTCTRCTLLNALSMPKCGACDSPQPGGEELKKVMAPKPEKEWTQDWFETLLEFMVTSTWLSRPNGAPPLRMFRRLKPKYDELADEYDLSPDELLRINQLFANSSALDNALLTQINKVSQSVSFRVVFIVRLI
jgi:hypothetical protein